jgi:hypothetical protein
MDNPKNAARNSARLQELLAETEQDKQSAEIAYLRVVNAELLEALEGMLREFGNQRFDVRKDYSKMVYIQAARTAIAKARGE